MSSSPGRRRTRLAFDAIDVVITVVVLAHVFVAPHTKVEESFALQATHDAIEYGWSIDDYDHKTFPGVVPRTSIASYILAGVTSVVWRVAGVVLEGVRGARGTKFLGQVCARCALGLTGVASHASFRRDVAVAFGETTSVMVGVVSLCQFHMWFYASRPLMNVFALTLTTRGCGRWIGATVTRSKRDACEAVVLVTIATFLLRCDVVLLLAPMGMHMLACGLISLPRAVVLGGATAAATIAASVVVDSWFWGYRVWPEGSVLWYNTALNKSANWGTSPWYWYFASALPKSLLFAYPLALASVFVERRARPVMFACAFYVGMYSFLPHKELRFIFPTLPLFNLAASTVLARVWNNRRKRKLVALAAAGSLALSLCLVFVFTAASAVNYPGGVAFQSLHGDASIAPKPGSVHVDVPAAMTGVSRFGEAKPNSGWSYSKEEGLRVDEFAARDFDYLINAHDAVPGYEVADVVHAYAGLRLDLKSPPKVLGVQTRPEIYIHRRLVQEAKETENN